MTSFLYFILIFCNLSAFAETLTQEQFLSKVLNSNLDLKISQGAAEAAKANANGYNIPPPMVGLMQLKQGIESGTGFEVQQIIPFPTKLSGDHSARKYEYLMEEENQLVAGQQAYSQGRFIYFSVWQSQERIAVLNEKRQVLQDHVKFLRSVARSDSFAKITLLKTESEVDLLENDIEAAGQIFNEKQIDAALYINADPATFKLKTVEPPLSAIPKIDFSEVSHQVRAAQFQLESLKEKEFEAKSAWLPDFNLRYKEMNFGNSATKSTELMVGITLPFLFFWEPYALSSQASKARLTGEYEFAKKKRIFDSDKILLLGRATSLHKQIENLNHKLIPRAEQRVKLVHNVAARDMETIHDRRETMEAFPDLKLKSLDLRMEYEQVIANLDKYVTHQDAK